MTEDPDRSRLKIYRIADNFLAFYLGLVSRYRAEIDRGLGGSILDVLLSGLDDYLGRPWEDAVRAHVRRECASGRLATDVVAVGPWWEGQGQHEIDILALAGRSRRPVLVGEVKWARTVDGARRAYELRRKVVDPGIEPESVAYVIAARERVEKAPDDVTVITAADVFRQ